MFKSLDPPDESSASRRVYGWVFRGFTSKLFDNGPGTINVSNILFFKFPGVGEVIPDVPPSWGEFGAGMSGWYKVKTTRQRVPVFIPWRTRRTPSQWHIGKVKWFCAADLSGSRDVPFFLVLRLSPGIWGSGFEQSNTESGIRDPGTYWSKSA